MWKGCICPERDGHTALLCPPRETFQMRNRLLIVQPVTGRRFPEGVSAPDLEMARVHPLASSVGIERVIHDPPQAIPNDQGGVDYDSLLEENVDQRIILRLSSRSPGLKGAIIRVMSQAAAR